MGWIVGFVASHRGLVVSLLAAASWIHVRPTSRAARRVLLAIVAVYTLASIYAIPYALTVGDRIGALVTNGSRDPRACVLRAAQLNEMIASEV
jgi:hypothetical protein